MRLETRIVSPTVKLLREYREAHPRIVWRITGMTLLLAALAIPAMTEPEPCVRATMLATVVGIGLSFVWVLYWVTQPSRGTIRVSPEGPLRFVPKKRIMLYSIGAGLCFVVGGIIMIYTGASPGGSSIAGSVGRRGGGLVLVLGGLTFLVNQVPRLCAPQGISLDAVGVSWSGSWGRKSIEWEDLDSVTLGAERGARQLWLRSFSGSHHALYPMSFGSDPESVAEIIEYFRRRPSRRGLLVEPLAAIRAVAEIREPRSAKRQDTHP